MFINHMIVDRIGLGRGRKGGDFVSSVNLSESCEFSWFHVDIIPRVGFLSPRFPLSTAGWLTKTGAFFCWLKFLPSRMTVGWGCVNTETKKSPKVPRRSRWCRKRGGWEGLVSADGFGTKVKDLERWLADKPIHSVCVLRNLISSPK